MEYNELFRLLKKDGWFEVMKTSIKKPIIKLKIIKEDLGYTAVGQWKERSLITCGDNWEELQQMIVEMVNLSFEDLGYTYTIEEIQLEYDL